jgi:hypothetical protein
MLRWMVKELSIITLSQANCPFYGLPLCFPGQSRPSHAVSL